MIPTDPRLIYKLCARAEWSEAAASGAYRGSAADLRDGFIHFSTGAQLEETARRHFAGQRDLVLVAVDPAALGPALRWEPSRGGDLFPHLYGELPVALALATGPAVPFHPPMPSSVHAFSATAIDGTPRALSTYAGKVLLVVNVASECGLTPQYAGLEALHEQYGPRGLAVLGFPANEFGAQEPGDNQQIQAFCATRYSVKFDLFAKVKVKGPGIDPLFAFLTSPEANPATAGDIKWNFNKFLVGKDGRVIARFEPPVEPTSDEVKRAIEAALSA